jgi:hypothetical protein
LAEKTDCPEPTGITTEPVGLVSTGFRRDLQRFRNFVQTAGLLLVCKKETSMKALLVLAALGALATPALADEVGVGVGVGPGGAGVTVGQSPDRDRDRIRERETVVKEHEPADRTTVIKKEHDDGTRSKTIVKERD